MKFLKQHLSTGFQAAKANLVPALVLQTIAILIGLSYWFVPPVHDFFLWVANIKQHGGYAYSGISTALWAGALPLLLVRWQKGSKNEPLSRLPFFLIYWGLVGLFIDALYRFQAVLFGTGASFHTLACKIAVDMLIFTPFWSLPTSLIAYTWKDGDFKLAAVRRLLQTNWYAEKVVPLCISCWAVWIPPLAVIYALPPSLQVPIMNLVECLWVLMLMILTGGANESSDNEFKLAAAPAAT